MYIVKRAVFSSHYLSDQTVLRLWKPRACRTPGRHFFNIMFIVYQFAKSFTKRYAD